MTLTPPPPPGAPGWQAPPPTPPGAPGWQTPQPLPPRSKGGWTKAKVAVAVVVAFLVLGTIGNLSKGTAGASPSPAPADVAQVTSTGSPQPSTTTAAATDSPVPSDTPVITDPPAPIDTPVITDPPAPTDTPVPTPAPPKTLLNLSGSGIRRSGKFTTSGDWTIAWSYNCSSFGFAGNFIIDVQGDTMDVAANELGKKGSGTQPEYTGPGTFYLEMNSECTWHVVVKG